MKKVYILAVAVLGMVFTANAQIIDDNFDSYATGDVVGQAPHWVLWPGGTSAQVTTAQASSGSQSLLIRNNTTDDVLLLLGDKTSGTYTIEWDVYIPSNATGFYNFQEFEDVGAMGNFAGQIFIGATASGGVAGLITTDFSPVQFPYPSDTWFTLTHVIDLDNTSITIYKDGTEVLNSLYVNADGPTNNLGAIDFFSIDSNNEMYIDNVVYSQGNTMGVNDFATTNFNMYPNPVQNELHIRSSEKVDAVTIYNILGKVVYQAQPNTASPSIDTSNFSSGMYLVEVTIDGVSETVKVLK